MDRKKFLGAIVPLGATLSAMAAGNDIESAENFSQVPPILKKVM